MTGGKFIPEFHLKQPGFAYSACGSFTKNREIIQKFKETGTLKYLYRNELDKARFVDAAAYSDSKGLAKIFISDKILKDRDYEIVRNRGNDGCQRALASMVYKFFYKRQDRE